MSTILLALSVSALLAVAQSGGPTSFKLPQKRSPAPFIVEWLALKYARSLTDSWQAGGYAEQEYFCQGFLEGFTNPIGCMRSSEKAREVGYTAGKWYRLACPSRVKQTMEGFGYRAVEAEGEWTEGFETRIFRPRNQPKEVWWFHYMGISRADIPKGMAINHIPIRAVGFLSPAGHYGHFGSGDHQFYATSITLLDGNQPGELPRAK